MDKDVTYIIKKISGSNCTEEQQSTADITDAIKAIGDITKEEFVQEVENKENNSTTTPIKEENIPNTTEPVSTREVNTAKEKTFTTTKKILFVSWIMFVALIVLQILGYNVDTGVNIMGGAVVTIISSVYMWKSKTENKMRISYEMIDKLADKYGIENVVNLLQNILDD